MKGWENIALVHLLKEEFNTDVIVDNTVRYIALLEKSYGVTRELDNFLYIYFERSMGSVMIQEGRIYLSGNVGFEPTTSGSGGQRSIQLS